MSFRPRLEVLEDRQLLAVFLVTNTNNANFGSLRAAILAANVNPGADTIEFDIEPGFLPTISLSSPLPTLADQVFIDGTSQPGWSSRPRITVDGTNIGFGTNGLTTTADGCTVKGLALTNFLYAAIGLYSNNNVVAGNEFGSSGFGVEIANAVSGNVIGGTTVRSRNLIYDNNEGVVIRERSTGNVVQGNVIGETAFGNQIGVHIWEGASNNMVGGSLAGAGNVISNNSQVGVDIAVDSNNNVLQGNKIGTDADGVYAIPNGIGVRVGGSNNIVGGLPLANAPAYGASNLISGNTTAGVEISYTAAGTFVQGNKIGTNVYGSGPVANAVGIRLLGLPVDTLGLTAGAGNTVGGPSVEAGNLISGNVQIGIYVARFSAGLLVQGNKIGTNAAGAAAVANGTGAELDGDNSTVGGTAAGAGNLISGNNVTGVQIGGTGTQVQGNKVGTNFLGTAILANGDGFYIPGSNNTVGGTTVGSGNLISGNKRNGIFIDGANNLVQGNKIGTNVAGTVALANDTGVDINGSNNTLGGMVAGTGNLISGNKTYGVYMELGVTGNQVQGNIIGAKILGTAALPNGLGLLINGSNNTIGGTAAGTGNTIAYNLQGGVFIFQGNGNQIRGNSIFANLFDGIALSHLHFGNNLQPAPTLASATFNPATRTLTIKGTLSSTTNTSYDLEFFANPVGDPQGRLYLGTQTVTTGSTGSVSFTTNIKITTSAFSSTTVPIITATATDPLGNTSAFSAGVHDPVVSKLHRAKRSAFTRSL